METGTKTRRWLDLADAIGSAKMEGGDYDAFIRNLEDAVENLPVRFGDRAQLWEWLIREEGEAQSVLDAVVMMTLEVKSFVNIHRKSAEAREEDVFAPEFDKDTFKARACSFLKG